MQDSTLILAIFQFVIFIFSAILHEIAHGYAALSLGDPTAKYEGRLTLNPLKHIEWFGTIVLPLVLFFIGSPIIFGWAKPVPYNPYNLKDPKKGAALIALAGPATNLVIALVFGIYLRIVGLSSSASIIVSLIVIVNLVLAFFNLVPIPPLDGSKILFAFIPRSWAALQVFLERYSLFLLLIFLFAWTYVLTPVIPFFFHAITGLTF